MPCCLYTIILTQCFVVVFFYPPSPFLLKSASSLHSIRNSTKAIPHLNPSHGSLDHCLQSALIERIVSLMWHPVRCHVEMRTDSGWWTVLVGKMWFIFFLSVTALRTIQAALTKMIKHFSQSFGTTTVSSMVPASCFTPPWMTPSHPPHLSV